jgi:hypothetical protein
VFSDDLVAADWWEAIRVGVFPPHPTFRDVPLYVAVGATASEAERQLAALLEAKEAPTAYR